MPGKFLSETRTRQYGYLFETLKSKPAYLANLARLLSLSEILDGEDLGASGYACRRVEGRRGSTAGVVACTRRLFIPNPAAQQTFSKQS